MFKLTIDNKIIIEPSILTIPEFKTIWDSDKSLDKEKALNELKYVFFVSDFKSPYKSSSLDEKELKDKTKEDFMPDKWKETNNTLKAIEKYKELQSSKTLKLFDSLDRILSQIAKYYEDLDLSDIPEDKIDDKIKKSLENAEKIPRITAQIEVTRTRIEKELAMKDDSIRGKGVIQRREMPKNKRK